jgi:hypothetical protein
VSLTGSFKVLLSFSRKDAERSARQQLTIHD